MRLSFQLVVDDVSLSLFLLAHTSPSWSSGVGELTATAVPLILTEKRIDFKLTPLCFKPLNGSAPTCLADLLHLYTTSPQLRSSADTRVFRIPSFRTKSCDQSSFSYQAQTTWNQLLASIRQASSVSSFNSSLKTFLFSNTFSSVPLP